MKVGLMKFNDIAFPNNCESIKVYKTSDSTKICCRGKFFNTNSISHLRNLERNFIGKKSGCLFLPEIGCYYGTFTSLNYELSTIPEIVQYEFVFQCQEKIDYENVYEYTCDQKDNFWDIAENLNIDFDELVKINFGYTKSYFLNPGDKILLPAIIGKYI